MERVCGLIQMILAFPIPAREDCPSASELIAKGLVSALRSSLQATVLVRMVTVRLGPGCWLG